MSGSTAKLKPEVIGLKPTSVLDRLNAVLTQAWSQPFRVKSDYARAQADIVAMAASLQMITTKIGTAKFANSWRITIRGQSWLQEQETE